MDGGASDIPDPPPRRRRPLRAALFALLALAVAAGGIAWLQRRAIVQGYADDLLRARGVPARYAIAELGPGGQRLTGVVLGDPANPDLTADWVETDTRLTFGGARVTAVRAGRVRLRGRIVGRRVSLGVLDRLLPAPGGRPFAFPAIDLAVADARARLDTPAGPVGVKLTGAGGLPGGFAGQLAAVAPRLAAGGCTLAGVSAFGRVTIAPGGAPRFAGPVRLAAARCGGAAVADASLALDAALGPALDRWRGAAAVRVGRAAGAGARTAAVTGTIGFAGDARATGGRIGLDGAAARIGAIASAGWQVDGAWRAGGGRVAYTGSVAARGLAAPADWRRRIAAARTAGAGTPLAPLAQRMLPALARGLGDVLARADVAVAADAGGTWAGRLRGGELLLGPGGSGGRVRLVDGATRFGAGGIAANGALLLDGGALPRGRIALRQAAPGAPLTGRATLAPYRAGDASLALAPVAFRATPGGRPAFATRATLTGPLGDGRVEALSLPLAGGIDARGRVAVNPGCTPLAWRTLRVAGLALDPAALTLCPVGAALVGWDGARLSGGARVAAVRLTGRLGGSALSLAAAGGALRLGDGALRVDGLAVRLGRAEAPVRLDVARLDGRIAGGAVAGGFAGAGGRIGTVPLLLGDAAGDWRLAGGRLALNGALVVADAAAQRRFEPLPVRGVALTLADGAIAARGTLTAPGTATRVAEVAIAHRLADGRGHADIAVPGVAFGPALQPTALTPLTRGVVAEVVGTVAGGGRIDWTQQGVTSTGSVRTDGLALAAAFGPVTGLRGTLRFTDLLALESAPDQVATVASINPGVPVDDGTIRYRLLRGPMVAVTGARWPFAGGTLLLEPTLLDYSRPTAKRLTFRVAGLDAAAFLRAFDYRNLAATGLFDGTLPMVFDERGGRIEDGTLAARSGGTLAYVGEVSAADLGTWGNFAFQALKSLRYRELGLTLNGPLEGEMVTNARFGGIAQGEGAKSNFLVRRLARLPLVFNVRITAPFRGLIDAARGFYDPAFLVRRNLPTLLQQQQQQGGAIQTGASAPLPERKRD